MDSEPPKVKIQEDDVCVCFNLRKAARIITQIYDEVMRPLGYRATQINLLGVIRQQDGLVVKELAAFMDTDPTTVIRNLRVLEREGLIALKPGQDRRERHVGLTDKGHALLAKAYPLWKETQERIAGQVGRERLNQLLSDLQQALSKIHP